MASPQRREKSIGCGTILLLIIGGVIVLSWITGQEPSTENAPPRQTQPRQTETRTEADDGFAQLLQDGNGYDWNKLSDRDRMALCLRAAEVLGKQDKVAWEYSAFLTTFYGNSAASGNDGLLRARETIRSTDSVYW